MVATVLTPHIENVEVFLAHCHRRHYPAKGTIVYVGDDADVLYYIIEGSVAVVLEDRKEDRELTLAYLNPGDFIGDLGLFEKAPRNAWVRARTDCEIAEINYEQFHELSEEYPAFLRAVNTQLARRLRDTTRKLGNLAFLDVTGRVTEALMDLCKQPSAMTHPSGMQIKITRQEIGLIVGCSREMVGRVLKDLEQQGLMAIAGKTMVIFNTR